MTEEYRIIGGTRKMAIDLQLFDIVGIVECPEFHDEHYLRHGILGKEIKTGLYVQFRPGNSSSCNSFPPSTRPTGC